MHEEWTAHAPAHTPNASHAISHTPRDTHYHARRRGHAKGNACTCCIRIYIHSRIYIDSLASLQPLNRSQRERQRDTQIDTAIDTHRQSNLSSAPLAFFTCMMYACMYACMHMPSFACPPRTYIYHCIVNPSHLMMTGRRAWLEDGLRRWQLAAETGDAKGIAYGSRRREGSTAAGKGEAAGMYLLWPLQATRWRTI